MNGVSCMELNFGKGSCLVCMGAGGGGVDVVDSGVTGLLAESPLLRVKLDMNDDT